MRLAQLPLFVSLVLSPALVQAQTAETIPSPTQSASTQTASDAVPAPDATKLLQNAAAAFSGGAQVSSIALTGTIIDHSAEDQSGTFSAVVASTGTSQSQIDTGSAQRKEVQAVGDPTSCTWSGKDGKDQKVAIHNCLAGVNWILPSVSLLQTDPTKTINSVEPPSANDSSNNNVNLKQQITPPPADEQTAKAMQALSEVHVYFDQTTYLPKAMTFNLHPDTDQLIDIPIRVEYSDYRQINGVTVPFSVKRFQHDGLVLELSIQNVSVN